MLNDDGQNAAADPPESGTRKVTDRWNRAASGPSL
ncbi:unnamed protein product [Tetraodon nigroviridis]|uniref:(spotted green pufferfish) hypothetical protein n=1 Tax=Tetraodon nigroviridis TaxID=99883 RepID=Q4RWM9_TETNG|nr:unnamed protein product [Tetraodon nigroviridis]